MAFAPTREAQRRAQAEFLAVLGGAVPAYELAQFALFAPREEEFIRRRVERKLYEPELPNGGARERKFVERLRAVKRRCERELEAGEFWWASGPVAAAIEAWEAVCPPWGVRDASGRYYTRKPLVPKTSAAPDRPSYYDKLMMLRESARAMKDWEKKWLAETLLAGNPEAVSDFRMDVFFLLRDADGNHQRMVELVNVSGERSGPVILPSVFHAPKDFREWCQLHGNYNWGAGEIPLQALHRDVGRQLAFESVRHIEFFGWHPLGRDPDAEGLLPGLWFYDDCVYEKGTPIPPDERGVFEVGGQNYCLAQKGREIEFTQGRPQMRPQVKIEDLPLQLPATPETPDRLSGFFRETCRRGYETIGTHGAWLIFGTMLSYAAAPEIFARYSQFPGAFVHGPAGSGKSRLVEWATHFQGYRRTSGTDIVANCTATGMKMLTECYRNLCVWLDEFQQALIDGTVLGVLKATFERSTGAKYAADKNQRPLCSSFVVSGASTSSDAQVRSRFPHVQVSASDRMVNHMDWFVAHREYFFLFFRAVMERRAEFVRLVLANLKHWRDEVKIPGVDDRNKLVYGVPYAAWRAFSTMLQAHTAPEMQAFKKYMIEQSRAAGELVETEMDVNVFFSDLVVAFKNDAIPVNCFRLEWRGLECPPGHLPEETNQGRWTSYEIYIDPGPTLQALQIYLTKGRGGVALKRGDLQAQLSKTEAWIPGPHGKRFTLGNESRGAGTTASWGFKVDKLPLGLGYTKITDEQHAANLIRLVNPLEGHKTETADPRKGEFYVIVNAVKKAELEHDLGRAPSASELDKE